MLGRIGFRIGLILFAAAFVPLAALLFTSYVEIRNGLAAQIQEHILYNARIIAGTIESRIARSQAMLRVLCQSRVIANSRSMSRTQLEEELQRIQLLAGTFDDMTLLSPNGNVLASTTYDYQGEWSGQSWFLKARDGNDVLGRAHFILNKRMSAAEMCVPVRPGLDKVLCGRLPLQTRQDGEPGPQYSVGQVLSATPMSDYIHAFLLNEKGRVLVHPDERWLYELLPPQDQLRTLLAAGGGRLWVREGRGVFYGVAFVHDQSGMMDERWAVVVAASSPEALAPLRSYYHGMGIAALFGLFLAVALAVYLARGLTVPIRRLVNAVTRLAGGDLSARVEVRGSHELAALGRHFNDMAEDLALAMQRIRDSEQRFRTLVETAGEGIWALDQNGDILHANPSLERMCGVEAMQGHNVGDYLEVLEPHHASTRELIDPPVPSLEMKWRTSAGKEIWVIYAARRLEQNGQRGTETFAVITDITERKSMEHQLARYSQNLERMVEERTAQLAEQSHRLEEALGRAEKADRSKSDYLSRMSHEIRTPLNSIMGFADLTLMGISGDIPEKVRHDVKIIKDSAQYLLKMINDILDAAKIQAGMLDLEIGDIDAGPLVERIVESMQGVATKKGLVLKNDIPSTSLWIRADEMRFQQILNNLLSNALKYTDQGQVTLTAVPDGDWWRFVVEDTGIGIAEKDLPHIFEEFRQIKGTGREGSGLGLALVRLLVEKMNGRVWAESTYRVGSRFYFVLPAGKASEGMRQKKYKWLESRPPARVAILAANPDVADFLSRELLLAGVAQVEKLSMFEAARSLVTFEPEVIVVAPFGEGQDVWGTLPALVEERSFRRANPVLVNMNLSTGQGFVLGLADILGTPVTENGLAGLLELYDQQPRRILLAQDRFEEAVQTSSLLRRQEIEVVKAFTITDTMELLENVVFDCLLVDVTMGNGQGVALLERVRQRAAHVPLVMLVPTQGQEELRRVLANAADSWPTVRLTGDLLYCRG